MNIVFTFAVELACAPDMPFLAEASWAEAGEVLVVEDVEVFTWKEAKLFVGRRVGDHCALHSLVLLLFALSSLSSIFPWCVVSVV